MLDIQYNGANSVSISSKNVDIIVNPKLEPVGLKNLDVKNKVVLASENGFNLTTGQERLDVSGAGEYEVGDFLITAITIRDKQDDPSAVHKSTVYKIAYSDIKILVVGNIPAEISDDQFEQIGVVDICVLPLNNKFFGVKAIKDIDPRVVIPAYYSEKGLSIENIKQSIEDFAKEINKDSEDMPRYKIKSVNALPVVTTVVKLDLSQKK